MKEAVIEKIIDRAEKMGLTDDRLSMEMDLRSADEKFSLRLEEMLDADDFDFIHDILGIQNNIVRDAYPAKNFGFFVPRFAVTHKM